MPLFRHHHQPAPGRPGAGTGLPEPGLPAFAAAQGWAPAGDRPFDGHLEDAAWVLWAERYLLGCVSKGPFRSAGQVSQRIDEVLGVVAAIPSSVLPDHVDHAADDLIARAAQLTSMQQGLVFLQQLTPDERDRLARSDSPVTPGAQAGPPVQPRAAGTAAVISLQPAGGREGPAGRSQARSISGSRPAGRWQPAESRPGSACCATRPAG